MNNIPILISPEITFSRFDLGQIKITPTAKRSASDIEILNSLKRHAKCDFGEVSFEYHNGNLEMIEEMRGSVSSIYSVLSGKQINIITRLDEFEPHTVIVLF